MLAERIISTIDADHLARIRVRWGGPQPERREKYLDLEKWIGRNLKRVKFAGLDVGPRRRVIDLGCGCGYFLYICKLLGHEILGVDSAPSGSLFSDMAELLGVRVLRHRIAAHELLPVPDADVITAHMITFNGHRLEPWGAIEWDGLLSQFPGRTIALQMNREPDGQLYPPDLLEYFKRIYARIEGPRVFIQAYDREIAQSALAELATAARV